jgi:hypothetical protein
MAQLTPELELAKELINEKQFDKARNLLRKMKGDPTAQNWLEQLEKMAPMPAIRSTDNGAAGGEAVQPWQYAALEVKRSYGIQYKVNGETKAEWKDQPIYYALNELGREGWELMSFESVNEFSTYILKKPGASNNQKAEVWDQ